MHEKISINGKTLPIKFGFSALRKFSRRTGMKLSEMESLGVDMTLDSAIILIHCAIADGHRVAKKELVYSSDDLADDLDHDIDAIGRAMDVFASSMNVEKKKNQKKKVKRAKK